MRLEFEDYSFQEQENNVRVTYLTFFFFVIPKEEFTVLGDVSFDGNAILFDRGDEKNAIKKVSLLFSKYKKSLRYKINNNPAILVDRDNPIPLLGLQFLGIVDKGSEMIELKPITNCNMNCVFCSVDEGPDSRKQVDFVIEPGYFLDEFTSFMAQKNEGKYDLWINPHGEPLLYAPIVELVHGLKEHSKVGKVVVITNGMLLTEKLVDDLAQAGLDRFSISFHSPNPENSQKIFGTKAYNVEKVKKMVEYAAKKIKVVLTPVYIQGMNEKEMSDVIDWANALDVTVQIQKFCINKMGRNPIKEQGWETFFEELKKIEKETNTVLIQPLGKLVETGELPKPFKKDETIEVEILCSGRLSRDKIGRASDRAVLVLNCPKEKGKVKVRLIQSKHNIFVGVLK